MRRLLIILIALLGCDAPPPAPAAKDAPLRPSAPPPLRDSAPAPLRTPILRDVRLGARPDGERIVFEFEGRVPTHEEKWAAGPVSQCGSGEVVDLKGDAVLLVRFAPANAHTEQGEASGAPRTVAGQGRNIQQMQQICDFEGVVEWAVAVAVRGVFEVQEMAGPARLVIDVR